MENQDGRTWVQDWWAEFGDKVQSWACCRGAAALKALKAAQQDFSVFREKVNPGREQHLLHLR